MLIPAAGDPMLPKEDCSPLWAIRRAEEPKSPNLDSRWFGLSVGRNATFSCKMRYEHGVETRHSPADRITRPQTFHNVVVYPVLCTPQVHVCVCSTNPPLHQRPILEAV